MITLLICGVIFFTSLGFYAYFLYREKQKSKKRTVAFKKYVSRLLK